MSRIKEIVEELNKLPKGYISKKTIHGKTYFYLQRKENSKVISEYIKSNEVENYRKLLVRRNKLEKELNVLLESGKKLPILSKKAKELTESDNGSPGCVTFASTIGNCFSGLPVDKFPNGNQASGVPEN